MTALRCGALCFLVALGASGETLQFTPVSLAVVKERLEAVGGGNAKRESTLHGLFDAAGCSGDRLVEQKVSKRSPPNVICSVPGRIDSTIVVGAHFDFVSSGDGVIDNWSGASLLPSLFESMKGTPRRHNFVFVGFTDEEAGLVGSNFYVRQLGKEKLKQTDAMVNLDSLGAGTTKMETDRADKRLTAALAGVATTIKLPLQIVNAHQVGRSDSDSFQDKKVPSINIHSLTSETFPILHNARDKMGAIRLTDYYDSYHLIAAYLAYLDFALDTEPLK